MSLSVIFEKIKDERGFFVELAVILLEQVVIMLLYLCIGIMCHKTGLITKEHNKGISNLVLYVINPVLIFVSYQQDFSIKLLAGLGVTLILTVVGYVVFIVGAALLVRGGKDDHNRATEIFSVIYSNCGFILFQQEDPHLLGGG